MGKISLSTLSGKKYFPLPAAFKKKSIYWQIFEEKNNPSRPPIYRKAKPSLNSTVKTSGSPVTRKSKSSAIRMETCSPSALAKANNSQHVSREKTRPSPSRKRDNSSVFLKHNTKSSRVHKDRSSTPSKPQNTSSPIFKHKTSSSPIFKLQNSSASTPQTSSPVFRPQTVSTVSKPRTCSSRVSETKSRLLRSATGHNSASQSRTPRLCSDNSIFAWALVCVVIAAICNGISNVLLVVGTAEIWEKAVTVITGNNSNGGSVDVGTTLRDFATLVPYLVVLMTVVHILTCLLRLAHLTAQVTCLKEIALFISVACVMVMSQQSAVEMLFFHFAPNPWQMVSLLFLALSTGSHFVVIMLVGKYTFTGTENLAPNRSEIAAV